MNAARITSELALSLSRFDFIAVYLLVCTRKPEHRPRSYQVRYHNGLWCVLRTEVARGGVVYTTSDTAALYDYCRRGPLCEIVRGGDDWRVMAHDLAQRALPVNASASPDRATRDIVSGRRAA